MDLGDLHYSSTTSVSTMMYVAKRHIDEAGADEEGEIPRGDDSSRRRSISRSKSDEEAPNDEEPWSRPTCYEVSPFLPASISVILLRDIATNFKTIARRNTVATDRNVFYVENAFDLCTYLGEWRFESLSGVF